MVTIKGIWFVLIEASRSFRKNNDRASASSLAFYSTVSLIPALVLLTYILGFAAGSSQSVLAKTRSIASEMFPSYSKEILDELISITSRRKAIGIANLPLLLWSITPLLSAVRVSIGTVFKYEVRRKYLIQKLTDLALITLLLTSISAIAGAGVVLGSSSLKEVQGFIGTIVPFAAVGLLVFFTYLAFSTDIRTIDLASGALVCTAMWFAMRPAFNAFLTYNAGFGIAFGSLKSVFVVVVWVYLSHCLLLYGAEVSAALRRKDATMIKRLMEGRVRLLPWSAGGLIRSVPPGNMVFEEGSDGTEMYHILEGRVAVMKGGTRVAEIGAGRFFGEMSFLLSSPRSASVVALEDLELVVINARNLDLLTREYPEMVFDMLREMALRLKDTTALAV